MTEPGNPRDIFRLATCAACGAPLLAIGVRWAGVSTTDTRCAPCEASRARASEYTVSSIGDGR